jgi:hypothetical protein
MHPPVTTRRAARSASSCSLNAGIPYWIIAISREPQRGQTLPLRAVFTGSPVAATFPGSSTATRRPG